MPLPWPEIDRVLAEARPARLSGRVIRVGGLLVEGTLPGARMGMLCRLRIGRGGRTVPAEIVALLEDRVKLMPLMQVPGINVGAPIEPVAEFSNVAVGTALIGRVVNGWGDPIDSGPPLRLVRRYPLHPNPLNPMDRAPVETALPLGIGTVDGLLTVGAGQRMVVMAGAGVGKSTLLGMMARFTKADVTVVALIGERSREVKRFVEVELGDEGLQRAVVVAATSSDAVALRIRAAYAATAIAEYFRDQGRRVLLLMDSLSRVCQAQRELGLATGEMPTTRGYPPSAFAIIPELLERAGTGTKEGSITGIYTALLQADDLGDPVGDAIRAVTDGHIVLSRQLAEQAHFPAIDVLKSTSRVMSEIVHDEHRRAVIEIRRVLADLRQVEAQMAIGAYQRGTMPRFERALAVADSLRAFLRQGAADRRGMDKTRPQVLQLARRIREWEHKVEGEASR